MSISSHQFVVKAICLFCIAHHICEAFTPSSSSTPLHQHANQVISTNQPHYSDSMEAATAYTTERIPTALFSSFYDDFEDFEMNKGDGNKDEDEDEDDEDEYAEMDQRSIAEFKSKMSNMFDEDASSEEDSGNGGKVLGTVEDLIKFARTTEGAESSGADTKAEPLDWAKPTTEIRPGTVLVANPSKFCADGEYGASSEPSGGGKDFFASALGRTGPAPSLLAKFGLTQPPPRHLGADRQADLLPVVIVVSVEGGQIQGILLNRRTGYLLGDLEQPSEDASNASNADMAPILEKFCIQPLWFGGIDSLSVGLDMLHLCPTVNDAKQITEDGMYWGGDPTQAQDAMEDPSLDRIYSGFDFKFFVQSTVWSNAGTLQSEIDEKVWFSTAVSQNLLFKVCKNSYDYMFIFWWGNSCLRQR